MKLDKGSCKAAVRVLSSIRREKIHARNAVYRALHHAESALSSCLGMVRFPKRNKKTRRKSKAKKEAKSG